MQDKYYSSQEFKELLHKYEAARKQGSHIYLEPDQLTDIAEYYYEAGQQQLSLEIIRHALTVFPQATAPLIFMARHELLFRNNPTRAQYYLDKITDTTDLEYIYLKAEILLNEDKPDQAEAYLHQAYNALNDDDDIADFVLDVATIYADYDMPQRARQWLDKSSETHLADYKEIEGRIAISQGQYQKSEDIFKQLLDEDPYSTPYWNHLATSQFQRHHINDAITSSEYSIAINPNDQEAILNKANGLYALANYEEALHYYERFTQLCPHEDTGYLLQAITLLNINRPEDALDMLYKAEEEARPNSSNLPEIYQEMAFTLSQLQRVEQALCYLDKAEALADADPNLILVMRGHIMLQHGNIEEANRYFQAAIKQSGNTTNILLHVSIALYDCGYIHFARKMLETLTQDQQQHGYAYLAACHQQLGNRKQYLQNLKKACTVNPEEARTVFFEQFPPELPPEEYYNYETNKP